MSTTDEFYGAKVALFIGDKLLIILRDDFDHIAFPNLWDFPGGGREGDETPYQTLAREVMEEVGLTLPESALSWQRLFPAIGSPGKWNWFFVGKMPPGTAADIVFGDEGQGWKLITLADFYALEQKVPSFEERLRIWEAETGGISAL